MHEKTADFGYFCELKIKGKMFVILFILERKTMTAFPPLFKQAGRFLLTSPGATHAAVQLSTI